MAYPLQAKMLRVLEEGVVERVGSNKPIRIDVRVLSSTNRDLAAGIRNGTFREDLYYRLNVFHIQLPPLRERVDDIGPLAQFFLREFGEELGKGALQLADDAAAAADPVPVAGQRARAAQPHGARRRPLPRTTGGP